MLNTHLENELLSLQTNMRNYASLLTMGREEAEDLLQETNLKVIDNCDKFIENNNFNGWVFTIMKNIFINNYRAILRNKIVFDKSNDLYYLNLCQNSGFYSPEGSYFVGEINDYINSFLDEYRITFSMYVQGYKYKEISEIMHIPIGTVKSRIYITRKHLQKKLKDF
ncbi:MAG: RNA polymerase subunit sigma [Bacteroidales bacterium 36-12]|nr:MAG: RNA polymerase subunit sigma [Bacteroidales bacterium 36-12]